MRRQPFWIKSRAGSGERTGQEVHIAQHS
jgi:hypothetical protein